MIRKPILVLIRLYQRILSPHLPATCRFYPSCSDYAAEAITRHGILHGSILTVKRLSRCHPWHEGGHDPVDGQAGGSSWKNG